MIIIPPTIRQINLWGAARITVYRLFRSASGGAACQTFYAYTITPGGETLNYEAVHRCEGEYTYYSAQGIDSDNSDHGTDGQPLSVEDGEERIKQLTDEDYIDDDAPFVKFIPLF